MTNYDEMFERGAYAKKAELEGAELELAVAKVMEKPARIGTERTAYGDVERVYLGLRRILWQPLTNPAQRMEVHDWVRAQGYDVEYAWLKDGRAEVSVVSQVDCNDAELGAGVLTVQVGPDDAHALLRAVVEMGR